MDDRDFEKMDRAFMSALKGARENPQDAAGVAAEVERRIRGAAAPARSRTHAWPWLVPALALSLVLAVPALRPHRPAPQTDVAAVAEPARVELASKPSASSIAEEIAALKEVGAWTDEDDRKVAPDAELEEVELSRAPSQSEIV